MKSAACGVFSVVLPALAVEVISPNDVMKDVIRKINDDLAVGILLIWVADPDTRTVLNFRGDGSARNLRSGEFLEGEDVFPGVHLEIAARFE